MTTLTRLLISGSRTTRLAAGSFRYKATAAETRTVENEDIKPYSELPQPKGLPIVGTLFDVLRNSDRIHLWYADKHREIGPILRNKVGIADLVFVADVDAVEQMMRQGGKYPERMPIDIWLDHRKRKNIPLGVFQANGPQWHNLRRVVDKPMMKIKTVNSYAARLGEVSAELVDRMYRVRRPDNSIPDLDEELYGWSMESICQVLFEKRMGCLSDNREPEVQAFIDSAHAVFECTRKMSVFPAWLARIVTRKTFNELEDAWDTMFTFTEKVIDEKLREIKSQVDKEEELGLVATFVKEEMTDSDIHSNVSELMGAAIDTTSNTTMMILYEISRNPEVQEKLYEEVRRVIPPGELPTPDHLKDMHYLKAVIKETLRMHPIGNGVMRKLNQDTDILGYRLPKDTVVVVLMYIVGRDPRYYDDPDTFRPERWIREAGKEKVHPFAWLPFGFGPRMCIGRRVAELEIQLLMSQLVRKFHIEPVSMEPIEMKTDLLLVPKTPVQIKLRDRT